MLGEVSHPFFLNKTKLYISHTLTKISFWNIKKLNVKSKAIKTRKEDIWEKL